MFKTKKYADLVSRFLDAVNNQKKPRKSDYVDFKCSDYVDFKCSDDEVKELKEFLELSPGDIRSCIPNKHEDVPNDLVPLPKRV